MRARRAGDASRPAGAFFAIEGGDGSGKGTVVAELASRLRRRGMDVLTTREPGGTPEGQALRELLLRAAATEWEPWAELLLIAAARVQHVGRVIRPALAARRIVISDRFVGSTIAYQGAGRGLPVAAIETLHRQTVEGLWPDLTLVLDVEPSTGLSRSRARLTRQGLDEGRFEALDLAFHERVRASFLAQALDRSRPHVVVDASRDADTVAAAAFDAVKTWLDDPISPRDRV